MLIGASSIYVAALNSSEVIYLQDKDSDFYFSGNDSFKFTIDDGKYYMQYRTADMSEGVITLEIDPINDMPTTSPKTMDFTGKPLQFLMPVSDPDGPDSLTITISSSLAYGTLKVEGETESLSKGDTVFKCYLFF